MKKFLVLIVSLVLLASSITVSCMAATTDSPDIKAIKDRGVLKVGVKVDVPKFGYRDPKTDKIDGFEVDIAKVIAKKILGNKAKVNFQAVNAKTRGPLLDNGEVDLVIATFTITDERKKSYNFSDPYFTDGVGLLVKKAAKYKSLQDLNGKKIGVAQSSTSRKAIQDEADKLSIKVDFLEYATYPEIKAALDSGRVDCFSVDGSILNGYVDRSTVVLPDRFSPQNYGIASKKGNDGLAQLVNETINEMKTSGQIDKLIKKWKIK
jgi:putative glutamine transport system substrate-binding protein